MSLLIQTHNPKLTSWVASANQSNCDFTIQNLPFAVLRRRGSDESFRGDVATGNQVVDLTTVYELDLFNDVTAVSITGTALPIDGRWTSQ